MRKYDYEELDRILESKIRPKIKEIEEKEYIPKDLINEIASLGLFGLKIPENYNGYNCSYHDMQTIHEILGRYHSSIQNMVTVTSMVSQAILKSGSDEQKSILINDLVLGKKIGAFALTEPDIGSNIYEMQTTVIDGDNGFQINGYKKWITLGQIADFFLVFAKYRGHHGIFIVENNKPGLIINKINNILGLKGNMLAELKFDNCWIPRENALNISSISFKVGISYALLIGRFLTACGCIGMARNCLDSSIKYTQTRRQFGKPLSDHQLIQKKLAEMASEYKAAKLLCFNAAEMLDNNDQKATQMVLMAKYYSSKTVNKIAKEAVQIHGANGISNQFDVERIYRDAKIMELIEGSSEMHEIMIAKEILRMGI